MTEPAFIDYEAGIVYGPDHFPLYTLAEYEAILAAKAAEEAIA